jgi:hypothetical protein
MIHSAPSLHVVTIAIVESRPTWGGVGLGGGVTLTVGVKVTAASLDVVTSAIAESSTTKGEGEGEGGDRRGWGSPRVAAPRVCGT